MSTGLDPRRNSNLTIIIKSLFDNIELPVFSGIISNSSTVQPVTIVTAHIMIQLEFVNFPLFQTCKRKSLPKNQNEIYS